MKTKRGAGPTGRRAGTSQGVRLPKLTLHKASGRGVVRLGGRDLYLGTFGTPECRRNYDQAIARWLAEGRPTRSRNTTHGITVDDLIAAWWPVLERRFSSPRSAATLVKHREALRLLHRLFGKEPATAFGPKRLITCRADLLRSDRLCRKEINGRIQIIRRLFRWGVAEELVPPAVTQGLDCVDHLRQEEGGRDSRQVRPVAWEDVEAVLPFVGKEVAALIQLQWWTGARSGELVQLRLAELDTSGEVWLFRPREHKTQHRGRDRLISFGPQAQRVLRPFLERVPAPGPEECLLSPARSEAERRRQQRCDRRSPLTPSQRARKRKSRGERRPGEAYDSASYRRAITRGIDAANAARVRQAMADAVPEHAEALLRLPVSALIGRRHEVAIDGDRVRSACGGEAPAATRALEAAGGAALVRYWHPHQLRHACATRVRHALGLDAARAVLGHTSAAVTEIYAEADGRAASDAMRRLG